MSKIIEKHKTADLIKEFQKQLHICLKNGTCQIIDRGLANCSLTNGYCDLASCPNLFKEEKHEV